MDKLDDIGQQIAVMGTDLTNERIGAEKPLIDTLDDVFGDCTPEKFGGAHCRVKVPALSDGTIRGIVPICSVEPIVHVVTKLHVFP